MTLADLAYLIEEPAWQKKAACRDLDSRIFFPDRKGPSDQRARQICRGCPVSAPCLDWALSWPAHYDAGIYAGTNAKERQRLRERAA